MYSTRNYGKKVTLRGVGFEIGVIGDFYWGLGKRISLDSSMGRVVWGSGGMPGCSANMIMNLTKQQLIVWLNNERSSSAMDNIFGVLSILNDKKLKEAQKFRPWRGHQLDVKAFVNSMFMRLFYFWVNLENSKD